MAKDEEGWEALRLLIEELRNVPGYRIQHLNWWQRIFHRHETILDGVVGGRFIERCQCGYGRINGDRWSKF